MTTQTEMTMNGGNFNNQANQVNQTNQSNNDNLDDVHFKDLDELLYEYNRLESEYKANCELDEKLHDLLSDVNDSDLDDNKLRERYGDLFTEVSSESIKKNVERSEVVLNKLSELAHKRLELYRKIEDTTTLAIRYHDAHLADYSFFLNYLKINFKNNVNISGRVKYRLLSDLCYDVLDDLKKLVYYNKKLFYTSSKFKSYNELSDFFLRMKCCKNDHLNDVKLYTYHFRFYLKNLKKAVSYLCDFVDFKEKNELLNSVNRTFKIFENKLKKNCYLQVKYAWDFAYYYNHVLRCLNNVEIDIKRFINRYSDYFDNEKIELLEKSRYHFYRALDRFEYFLRSLSVFYFYFYDVIYEKIMILKYELKS